MVVQSGCLSLLEKSSVSDKKTKCLAEAAHLCTMLITDEKASNEFRDSGGFPILFRCFLPEFGQAHPAILSALLSTLSQLLRASSGYCELFRSLEIYKHLPYLLNYEDSEIKMKAANLIGNITRHSDMFYQQLSQYGILVYLIRLCETGNDISCQRNAVFALGNCAFHSKALYPDLKPAVRLLRDLVNAAHDFKTGQNAVGALGNLVRNDAQLVPEMMRYQTIEAVLGYLERVKDIKSSELTLFSLGNFAYHKLCKEKLKELRAEDLITQISKARLCESKSCMKYVHRFFDKMAQPVFEEESSRNSAEPQLLVRGI